MIISVSGREPNDPNRTARFWRESISLILEAKFPASRQKFPVPLLREFRRKPLNSLVSSALNGV
jgi:hypothetical protein